MVQRAYHSNSKAARSMQDGAYCRVDFQSNLCDKRVCEFPISNRAQYRIFADSKIYFQGIGYCSLSEAALAACLELYVPGFKPIEGETYQIPIGNGRTVDFCLNDVLIEYHEPVLKALPHKLGDFGSMENYVSFLRELRKAGHDKYRKPKTLSAWRERLADNYYCKRREMLNASHEFQDTELIVAHCREDFYQKVILRFAPAPMPSLVEFEEKFWWWVQLIAKRNK